MNDLDWNDYFDNDREAGGDEEEWEKLKRCCSRTNLCTQLKKNWTFTKIAASCKGG